MFLLSFWLFVCGAFAGVQYILNIEIVIGFCTYSIETLNMRLFDHIAIVCNLSYAKSGIKNEHASQDPLRTNALELW